MTDSEEMSLGEVRRVLRRIEDTLAETRSGNQHALAATNTKIDRLSEKFDTYIGPVAVLETKTIEHEKNIGQLQSEMRDISKKAAQVSLIGALAAIVVGSIPFPWRRG